MSNYQPTVEQQAQFIWKEPLPCILDFGHELRRIGLNRVVDIGCRVGGNTIALAEIGLDVTALDSSMPHLDTVVGRAYDKSLDIKTFHHTSYHLPFKDESIHSFVTATAIHHSHPNESRELVSEIYRTLIPGGRVLVAVLSIEDYRFKTGSEIAYNTFADTVGPEIKNIHQFFTAESLQSLFDSFVPECMPFVVPSTFVLDATNNKKQGKLLVGQFMKGIVQDVASSIPMKLEDKLKSAKRSVELVVSYPNLGKKQLSSACMEFLKDLTQDMLKEVHCLCVVVGSYPIDTVTILEELQRFTGNKNFSLAYSEQSNQAQSLDIAIVDGVTVYSSVQSDSILDSVVSDSNPRYVNFFRQQLMTCWKKATVLLDNGKEVQRNILTHRQDDEGITKSESNVKVIDFKERKKEHIRVGITQLNLTGILEADETQLYKPDLLKLPNTIDHVLLKTTSLNLNLLLLPELSGDESLNTKLQSAANTHNMVIVGGSYYDCRRINCCPVAIPGREKPYIVEKINPSPFEISPNKNAGIVNGSEVAVFQNTVAGSFGVLICADFLNDALVEEVCNKEIDFLCVVSMNNDSPRFFEKMNLKCENYQRGIYILYSNCLFSVEGFVTDGLSSLFGFMDKLYLNKLKRGEVKHAYQITSFVEGSDEGFIVADINIDERRPAIGGIDRKPNILNIDKVVFE